MPRTQRGQGVCIRDARGPNQSLLPFPTSREASGLFRRQGPKKQDTQVQKTKNGEGNVCELELHQLRSLHGKIEVLFHCYLPREQLQDSELALFFPFMFRD